MTAIQVIVANPSDWVPTTNVVEVTVSNRRARPSSKFEYNVHGLSEETHYRVFLKLETTDAFKHKFYKERNSWCPHSVATQKGPLFEEHQAGLQTGEYWNKQVVQFKNLFISTRAHKSGAMVIESLRRYRASISIQDEYGQVIEFSDPSQEFVTRSPNPTKRSAKKDEETEPVMKKARTCEVVVARDVQHMQQFDNTGGYYDWQYDCRPEAHQIAEESKENAQPTEWIKQALPKLSQDQKELTVPDKKISPLAFFSS
uniref:T-box domain-containing protein n=1 Tax=Caenorhabditis tropicalis TaxID=1561998 RepID=A0A1I7T610_9PELO